MSRLLLVLLGIVFLLSHAAGNMHVKKATISGDVDNSDNAYVC
jgi:hypothetical protein